MLEIEDVGLGFGIHLPLELSSPGIEVAATEYSRHGMQHTKKRQHDSNFAEQSY